MGPDMQYRSILEEAFKNHEVLRATGPHTVVGLGGTPHEWTDVCGLVNPLLLNSQKECLVRKHGAFGINRKEFRLSVKDHTSHHETWIHLSHVSTLRVEQQRA